MKPDMACIPSPTRSLATSQNINESPYFIIGIQSGEANMAECIRFVCSGCRFSIESWSDGNPFYIDDAGKKKYAYHPDHDELEKCIANDEPHLCLECGKVSKIDSRLDTKVCSKCRAMNVVDTFKLEGVKCPKCEDGHLVRDNDFSCIS